MYKVRDFLTGKLLTTFLDLITLLVLIPFLFYLNSALAWIVLACSGADHADHSRLPEAAAQRVRPRGGPPRPRKRRRSARRSSASRP